MRKAVFVVLCASLALAVTARKASAIKPFSDEFVAKYTKDNAELAKKVETVKCAVCHDPKDKKIRNDYGKALDKLLEFIVTYQADPKDGIWLDTVAADGKPKVTTKAHNWKANYHDVRAMVKFEEAFGPGH